MDKKSNTKESKQGQNEAFNTFDAEREFKGLQNKLVFVLKTVVEVQKSMVSLFSERKKELELELDALEKNDLPDLQLLPGGKKFEAQPPFANHPKSPA